MKCWVWLGPRCVRTPIVRSRPPFYTCQFGARPNTAPKSRESHAHAVCAPTRRNKTTRRVERINIKATPVAKPQPVRRPFGSIETRNLEHVFDAGNTGHNPNQQTTGGAKTGAESFRWIGRLFPQVHALGTFSLACVLMRFLEGVICQHGRIARVRGKKATHSYAALSFLSVQNTCR